MCAVAASRPARTRALGLWLDLLKRYDLDRAEKRWDPPVLPQRLNGFCEQKPPLPDTVAWHCANEWKPQFVPPLPP